MFRVQTKFKARFAGLISFFIATSFIYPQAHGDAYRQYLRVSAQLTSHLIIESEDRDALLEESGEITSYELRYFKAFDNNIYLRLEASQGSDTLDWDGYSQGGAVRYQTASEYYISQYKAYIGRANPRYSSHIAISQNYRERNILTTTLPNGGQIDGLYEELSWTEVNVGYDYFFVHSNNRHLKIIGEIGASIAGDLHVEFNSNFDSADLRPGQIFTLYAGLEYFADVGKGFGVSALGAYKYTFMEKSQDQSLYRDGQAIPQVTFHQPVTEFQELSFQLGLSKRF